MRPELWLGPDLNEDLLQVLTVDSAPIVGVQGYGQQHAANDPASYAADSPDLPWVRQCGPNVYPRLAAGGLYSGLVARGLKYAAESAGLKDWSPNGEAAAYSNLLGLERVRAAGGDISYLSFDSTQLSRVDLGFTFEQARDVTILIMDRLHAAGLWHVGLVEAWPGTPRADTLHSIELLNQKGRVISHLHLDLDPFWIEDHRWSNSQVADELAQFQATLRAWSTPDWPITFGIVLHADPGRASTAQQVHDVILNRYAKTLLRWMPDPADRWIVQQFGKVPLPPLLPVSDPTSHLGLVTELAHLLGSPA